MIQGRLLFFNVFLKVSDAHLVYHCAANRKLFSLVEECTQLSAVVVFFAEVAVVDDTVSTIIRVILT